jgi:WD40 repeat protein
VDQEYELGGLAFNSDGRLLAVGNEDELEIFSTDSGARKAIPIGETVTSIAFSPDGQRVLGVGYNGTVTVAHVEAGKVLLQLKSLAPVRPNDTAANARVAFSPDGRTLISTNWDGSINLWNMPP